MDVTQQYLDNAHKLGQKVIVPILGREIFKSSKDYLKDVELFVKQFKDHPALGFWMLYDEPVREHASVQKLEALFKTVKKASPEIAAAIVVMKVSRKKPEAHFEDYLPFCDIVMVDRYPIGDIGLSSAPFPHTNLNIFNDLLNSILRRSPNKPVIAVAQSKKFSNKRYPVQQELKYFAYSSFAKGVNGLFWYSLYEANRDSLWVRHELTPVIQELSEFLGKTKKIKLKVIKTNNPEAGLDIAKWEDNSSTHLVVVNNSKYPRDIIFQSHNLWKDNYTVSPLFKTREKVISRLNDHKIQIQGAKPYEVFIWELKETENEKDIIDYIMDWF